MHHECSIILFQPIFVNLLLKFSLLWGFMTIFSGEKLMRRLLAVLGNFMDLFLYSMMISFIIFVQFQHSDSQCIRLLKEAEVTNPLPCFQYELVSLFLDIFQLFQQPAPNVQGMLKLVNFVFILNFSYPKHANIDRSAYSYIKFFSKKIYNT